MFLRKSFREGVPFVYYVNIGFKQIFINSFNNLLVLNALALRKIYKGLAMKSEISFADSTLLKAYRATIRLNNDYYWE